MSVSDWQSLGHTLSGLVQLAQLAAQVKTAVPILAQLAQAVTESIYNLR